MAEPIIRVEGLGKRFIIGNRKTEKYVALRDILSNSTAHLLKKALYRKKKSNKRELFLGTRKHVF